MNKDRKTYHNIKHRCYNDKCKTYKNYGGRGIKLYDKWIEDIDSFCDYIIGLDNYRKDGYSLDRINNNGDYEPGNLRWTDRHNQNCNRRLSKLNTSGYTGIYWHKTRQKWRSTIKINNKRYYLGQFTDKLKAIEIRNQYIIENNLKEYK